jgi:hypothetical protein
MTGDLLPISLSWCQAPWGPWPEIFFLNESLWSYSLCNILSDERIGLSLINRLSLCQVYISHIQNVIENSSLCTIYMSSVSPGFAKQMMSIFLNLCHNSSLVNWMVISLTATKFKPVIFSVWLCCVLWCEHVNSHDFASLMFVACTVLLYNDNQCQYKYSYINS